MINRKFDIMNNLNIYLDDSHRAGLAGGFGCTAQHLKTKGGQSNPDFRFCAQNDDAEAIWL